MNLAEVEARFYALVTARESVAASVAAGGRPIARAVEEMVVGDERLSAVGRLDIYADMYFVRIRDALRQELAKTAAVIGDAAFHDLALDYLDACRPAHPSLREAGARLPAFLETYAPLAAERPWLAELARLERVRLELFDGPDATPLAAEALRALPAENFAGFALELIPCHAILDNRFSVAPVWRSDDPAATVPEAADETLLVWRQGIAVFHRAVEREEADWLRRIAAGGVSFGALCDGLGEGRSAEAAAARAFELFGTWIADELLAAPG